MTERSLETFRPGIDDDEVLALRAAVWGADHPHGTPAFFQWLFARNPVGPGLGTMLRRGGQLVGFAGLTPRSLSVAGRTLTIAHGLDYMVHPAFRGSSGGNVAFQIGGDWPRRAAAAGYPFGVNFPNSASVRLLTSAKLGWQAIMTPSFLVRPLPGLRFQGEAPGKLPPWVASLAGRALGLALALRPAPRLAAGDRIVEIAAFDGRFDALWAAVAAAGGTAFRRDAATLTWRYVGHPVYRYRSLAVERNGLPVAFMVASPRRLVGLDSLLIVDALAAPGEEAALGALAAAMARDARRDGIGILGAQAAPGSPFETALKRAGFLAVPERFNPKPFVLIGLPLDGADHAALLRPEGWHLTWGDMDVV